MDNNDWTKLLRERYSVRTGVPRRVRLPSDAEIRFGGDPSRATIRLSAAAVESNVQTNEAAFEGWSLALMAWCGVEQVELGWDAPDDVGQPHYQRHLYRAARFQELMGDRIRIDRPDRLADLRVQEAAEPTLKAARATLNLPGERVLPDFVDEPRSEAELEVRLVHPDSPSRAALAAAFGLREIDRQLPVGVFAGEPAKGREIFTGGKSAIDIVAKGEGGSIWAFELKTDRNISVGSLSELFFYSMVLHDVRRDVIAIVEEENANGVSIGPADVKAATRFHARLLAGKFHPLVDDEVFALLNWNAGRLGWPVDYGMVKISPFVPSVKPQTPLAS